MHDPGPTAQDIVVVAPGAVDIVVVYVVAVVVVVVAFAFAAVVYQCRQCQFIAVRDETTKGISRRTVVVIVVMPVV